MSSYLFVFILGIIALLLWQQVAMRLIRRFVDMIMLLIEGEPEAWLRVKAAIDRLYVVASISYIAIFCHSLVSGQQSAIAFAAVPYTAIVIPIAVLRVRRMRLLKSRRQESREMVLKGIDRPIVADQRTSAYLELINKTKEYRAND